MNMSAGLSPCKRGRVGCNSTQQSTRLTAVRFMLTDLYSTEQKYADYETPLELSSEDCLKEGR